MRRWLLLWRFEPIRLRSQLAWLLLGAPVAGAVAAIAWLGHQQASLLAAMAGMASLAVFGRGPREPEGDRGQGADVHDLRATFLDLCSGLRVSGVLYACFDDEQILRPVVSTEVEPATPLRIGDDPITQAMHTLKPHVFTAYAGPTTLGKSSFEGRSTLVYPIVRLGRPVGLALLTSERFGIGQSLIGRLRAADPMLGLLLENEVLAGRLTRSQSEKEALLALARLAQGQRDSEHVFQEAALHLRRLTGASHGAIALRSPDGRLELKGFSSEGGAQARDAFMAPDWAEREWPNIHRALTDPSGSALLSLARAPLTPTEAAWAQQIAPDGHLLCVAFGPRSNPEGLVLLCWPEDGALRIHESRLAQRLGDLMALIAETRRQGRSRLAAEAQEAASTQVAAAQEALMGKLALEVRNAAFAVRHWRSELMAGAMPPDEVVRALDHQATALSGWLGSASAESPGNALASLQESLHEAQAVAREACRRKAQTLVMEAAREAELSMPRQALVQILGVLLDNASRFSGSGTSIRVWTAVSAAWATVYVADQGMGIPEQLQGRIAAPGFQVEPARGGQGMALAHARELVERAGGMLGFTSKEGEGSTFYVTLPVGRPDTESASDV